MSAALLRAWRETSLAELLAVLLGVSYALLIMRRNRLGWIAGAGSSLIYVVLAARAGLPMQSVLQGYYVLMSAYGWYTWTRAAGEERGIQRWPWRWHLWALLAIAGLSLLSAQWLARETHAAWPYLDSLTTWISLLATWMVARMTLENWLYWIAADAMSLFLYATQGYRFTALLFLVYTVIAVIGLRAWQQKFRLQGA